MTESVFVVAYNPIPTANRVARARGGLRVRVVSTLVSLVFVAVAMWLGGDWGPVFRWGFIGVWGAWAVVWLALGAASLARAKKDLAAIDAGPALVISPSGVEVPGERLRLAWDEIGGIKVAGTSLGAGPSLVVSAQEKTLARVPVSFLDALPASIDSAIRAYSSGRHSLDLSGLDSMI